MIATCPTCRGAGHIEHSNEPPRGRLQRKLADVGDDWTIVAIGASRWFKRQAERSYGARYEFRATWREGGWMVEARQHRSINGGPALRRDDPKRTK